MVIMSANPLDNIKNSNTITHVMKNGRLYDGNTLDEIAPGNKKLDDSIWKKQAPVLTTSVKQ
jgi:hypothetical protein